MLEGKMGIHFVYEKNFVVGNNTDNFRNGSYLQKIQTEHGEFFISILYTCKGLFKPIALQKHESCVFLIEKLIISLYSRNMSVSVLEE